MRGRFAIAAVLTALFNCTFIFSSRGRRALLRCKPTWPPLMEALRRAVDARVSRRSFFYPTGSMVTISTSPEAVTRRVLLIGDASHAILPFYGRHELGV
jgi:kynurenine 3-monooxygenase